MFVVQDYLMKWLVGVGISMTTAATIGGFNYVRNVSQDVQSQEQAIIRIEGKLDGVIKQVERVDEELGDIPRGNGLSPNQRERMDQMEEDIGCIRGHLSGQRTCPPPSSLP